nr:helix-turn-helix domain-containing protein [Rhodoferax sp.]
MAIGYIPPSILWHLLHTGPATAATLARVIGRPRESINKALRRMRVSGHVTGRPNTSSVLELTVKGIDAARATDSSLVEPPVADQAAEPAAVVRAPCFDRMRAPAHVPDPGQALRPGALDYKRVATVGLRC